VTVDSCALETVLLTYLLTFQVFCAIVYYCLSVSVRRCWAGLMILWNSSFTWQPNLALF